MNIVKLFNTSPITFNDVGFFNATEAAAVFGKRPSHWLDLDSTKEYMAALVEVDAGNSGIALIVTKKGGKVV